MADLQGKSHQATRRRHRLRRRRQRNQQRAGDVSGTPKRTISTPTRSTGSPALTVARVKPHCKFSHPPTQLSVVTRGAPRVLTLQAAGGEGSSEPVVGRTTASSSSKPARTCVQRVSVRGAGQGQAAGRRRHSVPRPVHPPHRQQRGAGAVECYSQPNHKRAAPKGGRARQASLRPVGLSPGGGGGVCGFCPSSASRLQAAAKS